ncbi:MAG: carbohydrate deacetylase [Bryobacteraceae bacterium]
MTSSHPPRPAPPALINADDFGLEPGVNRAIARAFGARLISTCSIMATGIEFEEACWTAHEGRFADRVGLHLVLDAGRPLTEAIRRERRFCSADGWFLPRRKGAWMRISGAETQAVRAELRAQLERCRAAGLRPRHLDSHHHVHEELGILRAILPVMREEGILRLRVLQNLVRARTFARRVYTATANGYLKLRGLAGWNRFGAADDLVSAELGPDDRVEVMVHPGIGANGVLVDLPGGVPLAHVLAPVLSLCQAAALETATQHAQSAATATAL